MGRSYWNETIGEWVDVSVDHQGSARVFYRTNSDSNLEWEQQGDPLIVDDGEGGTYFGYRVAISGNTAAVSASHIETHFARLFMFERTNDVWEQTAMLHSGFESHGSNIFRLALDGDIGMYIS